MLPTSAMMMREQMNCVGRVSVWVVEGGWDGDLLTCQARRPVFRALDTMFAIASVV
jgi:hypothetical protein